jgi:hypothetical protein
MSCSRSSSPSSRHLAAPDHDTYFVGYDEWGFSVWAHNADDYVDRIVNALVPARGAETRVEAAVVRALENPTMTKAEFESALGVLDRTAATSPQARMDAAWRAIEQAPRGGSTRPALGARVGAGTEGTYYRNPTDSGWGVKVFDNTEWGPIPGKAQRQQGRMNRLREALPETGSVNKSNVARTRGTVNEEQNWLETEMVIRERPDRAALDARQGVIDALREYARDSRTGRLFHRDIIQENMVWGRLASDPPGTPARWILVE